MRPKLTQCEISKSDDYTGGRFFFDPTDSSLEQIVEPIAGRVSAFTSGAENPHRVEKE